MTKPMITHSPYKTTEIPDIYLQKETPHRDYFSAFGFRPELTAQSSWIAPGVSVIGEVHIGEHSSIWFGSVLRGDTALIQIGNCTNIQDLCCLHADSGSPCKIGDRVSVGHRAIVHGATVEDDCLIGMGAIILSGAYIGKGSIVGAGALVPEGARIPPGSLVLGIPAKVSRPLNINDWSRIKYSAEHYVELSKKYRAEA